MCVRRNSHALTRHIARQKRRVEARDVGRVRQHERAIERHAESMHLVRHRLRHASVIVGVRKEPPAPPTAPAREHPELVRHRHDRCIGQHRARSSGHLVRAIPVRDDQPICATGDKLAQTRRHAAGAALDTEVRCIVPTFASRGTKEHRIDRQARPRERGCVIAAQIEEWRMIVRTQLQRARLHQRRFVTSRSSITRYWRSEPTNMVSASDGVHTIGSPCRFSDVFNTTASPVSVSRCSSSA